MRHLDVSHPWSLHVDMDLDEIRTTFADRGVIRLDGAFSAASAARYAKADAP